MNSAIRAHFDKLVTIQRLDFVEESGDPTDKQTFINHLLNVACHIQPDEASPSEDIPGSMGKRYIMYADSQDIAEGDRVLDGSDEYRVIGAEKFEFLGRARHMEIVLRKF